MSQYELHLITKNQFTRQLKNKIFQILLFLTDKRKIQF